MEEGLESVESGRRRTVADIASPFFVDLALLSSR